MKGCGTSIPRDRHFCPECWKLVPRSVKGLLRDYARDYGLDHKRTREVLEHATQLARKAREVRNQPPRLRTLFPEAEAPAPLEDPG